VGNNLKTKAVNGLLWGFIDNFSVQISQFLIGIVLARLLEPKDFGLIGMMVIFITISQWFISSGFGQALIRKKDCTHSDYSTIFFFNIVIGVFFYGILFFSAPLISVFFVEPRLELLIKVFGLSLIIISLTIIQRTQLTKRLDFKLQTKISIVSSLVSGGVAIYLAYEGFGVWSLIYKSLIEYSITLVLLWFYNSWYPSLVFDVKSFKELFGFGSKLLLRGLIYSIFNNIYYIIIGKYFTASQLGFFTRAEQFNRLPSSNINKVVNKVSYPVLSELQDDDVALKNAYKKIFTSLVFVTSIAMLLLAAVAEPLIIFTIGEKWRPTIRILQPLCFVGLLYPLADFNLTILKVKGRSDTILKLEVVKRILSVPVILIGVYYGLQSLLLSMIVLALLEFFVNAHYSGKQISYSLKEQVIDNLPNFCVAILVGFVAYVIASYLPVHRIIVLVTCGFAALLTIVVVCEFFKNSSYLFIKHIVMTKLKKHNA